MATDRRFSTYNNNAGKSKGRDSETKEAREHRIECGIFKKGCARWRNPGARPTVYFCDDSDNDRSCGGSPFPSASERTSPCRREDEALLRRAHARARGRYGPGCVRNFASWCNRRERAITERHSRIPPYLCLRGLGADLRALSGSLEALANIRINPVSSRGTYFRVDVSDPDWYDALTCVVYEMVRMAFKTDLSESNARLIKDGIPLREHYEKNGVAAFKRLTFVEIDSASLNAERLLLEFGNLMPVEIPTRFSKYALSTRGEYEAFCDAVSQNVWNRASAEMWQRKRGNRAYNDSCDEERNGSYDDACAYLEGERFRNLVNECMSKCVPKTYSGFLEFCSVHGCDPQRVVVAFEGACKKHLRNAMDGNESRLRNFEAVKDSISKKIDYLRKQEDVLASCQSAGLDRELSSVKTAITRVESSISDMRSELRTESYVKEKTFHDAYERSKKDVCDELKEAFVEARIALSEQKKLGAVVFSKPGSLVGASSSSSPSSGKGASIDHAAFGTNQIASAYAKRSDVRSTVASNAATILTKGGLVTEKKGIGAPPARIAAASVASNAAGIPSSSSSSSSSVATSKMFKMVSELMRREDPEILTAAKKDASAMVDYHESSKNSESTRGKSESGKTSPAFLKLSKGWAVEKRRREEDAQMRRAMEAMSADIAAAMAKISQKDRNDVDRITRRIMESRSKLQETRKREAPAPSSSYDERKGSVAGAPTPTPAAAVSSVGHRWAGSQKTRSSISSFAANVPVVREPISEFASNIKSAMDVKSNAYVEEETEKLFVEAKSAAKLEKRKTKKAKRKAKKATKKEAKVVKRADKKRLRTEKRTVKKTEKKNRKVDKRARKEASRSGSSSSGSSDDSSGSSSGSSGSSGSSSDSSDDNSSATSTGEEEKEEKKEKRGERRDVSSNVANSRSINKPVAADPGSIRIKANVNKDESQARPLPASKQMFVAESVAKPMPQGVRVKVPVYSQPSVATKASESSDSSAVGEETPYSRIVDGDDEGGARSSPVVSENRDKGGTTKPAYVVRPYSKRVVHSSDASATRSSPSSSSSPSTGGKRHLGVSEQAIASAATDAVNRALLVDSSSNLDTKAKINLIKKDISTALRKAKENGKKVGIVYDSGTRYLLFFNVSDGKLVRIESSPIAASGTDDAGSDDSPAVKTISRTKGIVIEMKSQNKLAKMTFRTANDDEIVASLKAAVVIGKVRASATETYTSWIVAVLHPSAHKKDVMSILSA